MKLPAVCQRSSLWFILFAIWLITLWFLSSRPLYAPPTPSIPFLDKVLHFGYFFGGAGLLSAALYLLKKKQPAWDTLYLTVIIICTCTGALDEWHQSWYEFRSGNDAGDLAADFIGAITGTIVFRKMRGIFDTTSER